MKYINNQPVALCFTQGLRLVDTPTTKKYITTDASEYFLQSDDLKRYLYYRVNRKTLDEDTIRVLNLLHLWEFK